MKTKKRKGKKLALEKLISETKVFLSLVSLSNILLMIES